MIHQTFPLLLDNSPGKQMYSLIEQSVMINVSSNIRASEIGLAGLVLAGSLFHSQDTENLPKSRYTILSKKQNSLLLF